MDKVSVIMPAYNAEKFIEKSIKSVLNQTYENIELVIVNDGATDDTPKIIEHFENMYPEKILFVNKAVNEGTAITINTAMNYATGDYMCWLSADDLYVETMIESQLNFLKNHTEYEACFSLSAVIDENDKILKLENFGEEYIQGLENCAMTQPYRRMLQVGNSFHGCAMLGKREKFISAGGFDPKYRYAHDYDFWLRFAADTNIGFYNEYNVLGRVYDTQISRQGHNDEDAIRAWYNFTKNKQAFEKLRNKAGYETYKECVVDGFNKRIWAYSICNKKREMNVLLELYSDYVNGAEW